MELFLGALALVCMVGIGFMVVGYGAIVGLLPFLLAVGVLGPVLERRGPLPAGAQRVTERDPPAGGTHEAALARKTA